MNIWLLLLEFGCAVLLCSLLMIPSLVTQWRFAGWLTPVKHIATIGSSLLLRHQYRGKL